MARWCVAGLVSGGSLSYIFLMVMAYLANEAANAIGSIRRDKVTIALTIRSRLSVALLR